MTERMTYTRSKAKHTGLVCPTCGCRHIPVAGTYRLSDGVTRRYRVCRHCGRRFSTHESTRPASNE